MKTRNRVISLLLTACMMLSLCAAFPLFTYAEADTATGWDGTTATKPEGTGTQTDPYLIASAENLLWIQQQIPDGANALKDDHPDVVAGMYTVSFADKYFLQTQDIDLNGKDFASIGYYFSNSKRTAAFGGIYDGQGFAIRNGKITTKNTNHSFSVNWGNGLFGMVYGATIKNIVLDDVEIEGYGVVGAIVGRAATDSENAGKEATFNTIENCVVNANCTITAKYPTSVTTAVVNNASRVGGIVGIATGTTVRYCVNNAPIHVPGNWCMTGGIAGSISYNAIVEYCVNTGKITYDLASMQNVLECAVGGLVGYLWSDSGNTIIRNSYNSGAFQLNMGDYAKPNQPIYWGGILGGANSLKKMTNKIENCYNLHALKKGANGIPNNIAEGDATYRFGGLLGSYWIATGNPAVGVLEVKTSFSVDIDENAYWGSNECRYYGRTNDEGKMCVDEETSGTKTADELAPLTQAIDVVIAAFNKTATAKKVGQVAYQFSTGTTNSVRISAQIVGKDYEFAGFKVYASYVENGTTKTSPVKDITLYTYYTSMKAGNDTVTPDAGNNFIAFVIDKIPTDKGDVTFTLQPYVVTAGGSSFGNTVTLTFGADGTVK